MWGELPLPSPPTTPHWQSTPSSNRIFKKLLNWFYEGQRIFLMRRSKFQLLLKRKVFQAASWKTPFLYLVPKHEIRLIDCNLAWLAEPSTTAGIWIAVGGDGWWGSVMSSRKCSAALLRLKWSSGQFVLETWLGLELFAQLSGFSVLGILSKLQSKKPSHFQLKCLDDIIHSTVARCYLQNITKLKINIVCSRYYFNDSNYKVSQDG